MVYSGCTVRISTMSPPPPRCDAKTRLLTSRLPLQMPTGLPRHRRSSRWGSASGVRRIRSFIRPRWSSRLELVKAATRAEKAPKILARARATLNVDSSLRSVVHAPVLAGSNQGLNRVLPWPHAGIRCRLALHAVASGHAVDGAVLSLVGPLPDEHHRHHRQTGMTAHLSLRCDLVFRARAVPPDCIRRQMSVAGQQQSLRRCSLNIPPVDSRLRT